MTRGPPCRSQFRKTIPILRIFEATKAEEFYVGFLGFDREDHFEKNTQAYSDGSVGNAAGRARLGCKGGRSRNDSAEAGRHRLSQRALRAMRFRSERKGLPAQIQ